MGAMGRSAALSTPAQGRWMGREGGGEGQRGNSALGERSYRRALWRTRGESRGDTGWMYGGPLLFIGGISIFVKKEACASVIHCIYFIADDYKR